ncbi:MAG: site-specific integrase [Kofleriaceae bacterium]|nr:site-specific integrase [Kofleriaceae bacterium]
MGSTSTNATTASAAGATDALARLAASAPELAVLVEAAAGYARASKAPRTRDAYRASWQAFEGWCAAHGLAALPASGATVALYLADRARAGRAVASLELDLAAVSQAHKALGHESPRSTPEVRAVWAGIRRERGVAQRRAAPVLVGDLRAIVGALPPTLLGLRDRALLLVGWAAALRRSELVSLQAHELTWREDGVGLALGRSKGDQEGRGERVFVASSSELELCPVVALRAWLEGAGITSGPVFRVVARGARVGDHALTGRSVARIVKRAARAAGLDVKGRAFSGHSLRAGLATTAARAGVPELDIMRRGRWKSRAVMGGTFGEAVEPAQ